jgi:hypothetical protein
MVGFWLKEQKETKTKNRNTCELKEGYRIKNRSFYLQMKPFVFTACDELVQHFLCVILAQTSLHCICSFLFQLQITIN